MVEVLKTNVTRPEEADRLVDLIQGRFSAYRVNFDLGDCDHILRVCSDAGVDTVSLLELLKELGFEAEVLSDTPPVAIHDQWHTFLEYFSSVEFRRGLEFDKHSKDNVLR